MFPGKILTWTLNNSFSVTGKKHKMTSLARCEDSADLLSGDIVKIGDKKFPIFFIILHGEGLASADFSCHVWNKDMLELSLVYL